MKMVIQFILALEGWHMNAWLGAGTVDHQVACWDKRSQMGLGGERHVGTSNPEWVQEGRVERRGVGQLGFAYESGERGAPCSHAPGIMYSQLQFTSDLLVGRRFHKLLHSLGPYSIWAPQHGISAMVHHFLAPQRTGRCPKVPTGRPLSIICFPLVQSL